ncbi:hypothetical protein PBI_ISOLDE_45 [Arthrobacter phage Isolde]|jgi:hypothetical protein|uniref:Uncharacterized protein n=1 Tax=Arthrobacter phage Isolde TaxID=2419610 RepID=A0A3G3M4K8_9CAUD|nr:hypothetical protein PP638_gp58 [Arthrobacter phage Isolde]AYR01014.1 hypothetical protein PBI_ISOLDE_45 [Arthrobacter phage Isolde]
MTRSISMAITVTDSESYVTEFASGTKWVIDEDERLHIVGDSGNLASYNKGAWRSVTRAVEA